MNKIVLFSFGVIIILGFSRCADNEPVKHEAAKKVDTTEKKITRSNKTFFSDCRVLLQDARKMDSILLTQNEIDKNSANKAISTFVDYANYCHNDSLGPIYLVKCAQVSRAINNIPQAKLALEKCLQDYPAFG